MLWDGAPRRLLHDARRGDAALFTSIELLAELTGVLARPKFHARLAAAQVSGDRLVAGYAALATLVRPRAIARTAPDPDDDVVIATALAANADLIVTGDGPLRSAEAPGLAIVTVGEALVRLEVARQQR